MRRNALVLAGLTFVVCFAPAEDAAAQRTESATTTRSSTVNRGDLFWSDITCVVGIRKDTVVSTPLWGTFDQPPIPNGGLTTQGKYPPSVYAEIILSNSGNRRATFATHVGASKPPGASWSFVDKSGNPLPDRALTPSMTVEAKSKEKLGPFYIKHVYLTHLFSVDVKTDVGASVPESNETNNSCQSTVRINGGAP